MADAQVVSRIICMDHNEVVILGCEKCDKCVCRLCITSIHKNHEFCQMDELISRKKSKIQEVVSELKDQKIPATVDLETKLKVKIDSINTERDKRKDIIIHRFQKLSNELKSVFDNKLQEIDNDSQFQDLELLNMLETVQKKKNLMQDICKASQMKLTSSSDYEIVEFSNRLANNLDIQVPEMTISELVPQNLSHNHCVSLACLFGQFTASEPRKKFSLSVRGVSSFVLQENTFMKTLVAVDKKKVWLCSGSKMMRMLDEKGYTEISINFNFSIKDLILTSGGNIVVSVDGKSELRCLNLSGQWKTLHDASPFKTRGMCLAKNGDILVCVQAKILRLSPCGKLLHEIQNDKDGSALFVLADRVTENINNDLVVIDWSKKCVLAVDEKFTKRFKYYGTAGKELQAYGITNDDAGHIFIADKTGNSVHILDKNGQFLHFLSLPNTSLESPRRISVGPDGVLWIGCDKGKVHCITFSDYHE